MPRKKKTDTVEVVAEEKKEEVIEATEPAVEAPKSGRRKKNKEKVIAPEEAIETANVATVEEKELAKGKKRKKNKEDNEVSEEVVEAKIDDKDHEEVHEKSIIEEIKEKELSESAEKKIVAAKEKTEKKLQKRLKKNKSREKLQRLETNIETGLTTEEVEERVLKGYINVKNNNSTKSIKKIIFTNIFTFFNILMLCIAGWLISVKAIKDLFFLVIVSLNIIIGIVQEIRAKMTIDKLSIISSPTAKVLRNGVVQEIGVDDIVIDDIILFETGKQISSDSIVVDGVMEVNESLLTGESDPILKRPGDMLYSGSFVVSGNCKARVDAVGEDNYIEKLTKEAKRYNKPKSELLESLNLIIRFMAVVIIPIGAILFCMQFDRLLGSLNLTDATRKTAGAMIGMIPSGLYLLTSIALAVGVIRLAQNNVLVQELYCIEMLARVDCLCLDKTGTITDGTMSVKNVIEYQGISGLSTKNIISAILNAHESENMTDKALEEKFGRAKRIKHLNLIPFSSQRKYSAVTFDKFGTFVMGAPEFVLTKNYKLIAQDVNAGAKQGYRVLVVAHTNEGIKNGKIDPDILEPVCLIYIEDTIRPDAIETIKYFKDSGVEVKVISGDNPLTVSRISERAGIENATEYISLEGLSDLEVIHAATKYTVFGRVSPIQKKLLVTTLKEAGKTVAMTGDGVNDILALKEADCSISVASGSEAARNVSHLVLLDNNFGSMPKVVSEGRRVINNVAKVSKLFLTKTIFSLLLAIYAIETGGNYPISTNQLFLIDTCCIGIPSFFLILEANNERFAGGFLINVIKGALPGAIVILFNAIIVLALSSTLNLDRRDTSTLIVIIATFTCLTVLYQTCIPWKLYKKAMYAILFAICIFVTVLLPTFLDFTPLSKISKYYDSDFEVVSISEWPKPAISEDGFVVINGNYTPYQAVKINQLSNVGGYLKVGEQVTEYEIEIVTTKALGYENNKYVYKDAANLSLGGIKTTSQYTADVDVQISYDGIVSINGKTIDYSIFPSVAIKGNKYVINGTDTNIEVVDTDIREVYINDLNVYINDKAIGYKLDPVELSVDNEGYIYVGSKETDILYSNADFNKIAVKENLTYTYEDEEINNPKGKTLSYDVNVEESKARHILLDGKYTKYTVSSKTNELVLSYDKDTFKLKVNGVKTDYVLDVSTTYGAQIQPLGISAMLLLIALCALTTPLMSFFKKIVPWCKDVVDNAIKIVSKL